MMCTKCGKPVTEGDSFQSGSGRLCSECFITAAQMRTSLSPEERKRLKKAVQEEMGAILPAAPIRQHIQDGFAALLKGEDEDEVVNRTVNQVQKVAGLALAEHVLDIVKSMQTELSTEAETIRDQIRKLGSL